MLRPTANINWIDGQPQSVDFEDVYFQVDEGFEECQHVFLRPNRVAERLRDPTHNADCLAITETGFGSGLNFIACYVAWLQLPEPKKHLEFTSIEGFPLTKHDLQSAAAYWPKLADQYNNLIDAYPKPIEGSHLIAFEEGRVRLRLILKPIEQALKEHSLPSDIWFLDGFTPSRNPEMWTETLFPYIASHSNPHATLSTFTSASIIRKSLQHHGFEVTKHSGFGPKREMISAQFCTMHDCQKSTLPNQPWHLYQDIHSENRDNLRSGPAPTIAVIGAGIAGLVSALTLSRRGYSVELIEQANEPLAGASSQPILIMYGKLPKKPCPESDLLIHSQLTAQRFYTAEQKSTNTRFWHPCGVAQIAWNEQEKNKQTMIHEHFQLPEGFLRQITAEELSHKSGLNTKESATLFPEAGWLDTTAFAKHVLAQENISFKANTKVLQLQKSASKNAWILHNEERPPIEVSCVVICNALDSLKLLPELELPLKPLRGQTTQLDATKLQAPHMVLCGEGYLCPPKDNQLHFGATYDLGNISTGVSHQDDLENIQQIQQWLPDWHTEQELTENISGNKAGLRTTSSDYTPIVGRCPDIEALKSSLPGLRHNAKSEQNTQGVYKEDLFINVGYGSKGLTFTPACADLICSEISNTPTDHTHTMRKQLSAARFTIRALKKGV